MLVYLVHIYNLPLVAGTDDTEDALRCNVP